MTKKEYIRQMDDERFTEMLVNYETTLLIPSCNEKYCEHCKGDGYLCAAKDDDVGGCGAGCSDCDNCTEFIRIREQYCKRCGATFYERADNDFCEDCRKARKKAAQKKYAILMKRSKNNVN